MIMISGIRRREKQHFEILTRFIRECGQPCTHSYDRHSLKFRAGRRSSGKSEGGLEEDYHEPQAAACVIPLRPDYGPRTSSCRCDLEINVQSSVCYCTGPYWWHGLAPTGPSLVHPWARRSREADRLSSPSKSTSFVRRDEDHDLPWMG